MLLRRITEHVKAQNWTAVALDFVIVVVGVFIGIQVSNWNDARADLADERLLLARMHDETRALLQIQRSEYAEHLPRFEAMEAIHPLLFDEAPVRPLTSGECRLIAISHWLPAPTDDLPILEEVIATGRIDLIADENVKENLRRFALARDRSRRQYAEAVNELFRLYSRHPTALWHTRTPIDDSDVPGRLARHAGEGYKWANECDLAVMRDNKAFQADYADNVSRLNSFIERYDGLIVVLEDLEAALSAEAGPEPGRAR